MPGSVWLIFTVNCIRGECCREKLLDLWHCGWYRYESIVMLFQEEFADKQSKSGWRRSLPGGSIREPMV
jgi:hypothetical protein